MRFSSSDYARPEPDPHWSAQDILSWAVEQVRYGYSDYGSPRRSEWGEGLHRDLQAAGFHLAVSRNAAKAEPATRDADRIAEARRLLSRAGFAEAAAAEYVSPW